VQTKPLALYCKQSEKIPLVFVQDVTGFMVGSKSEQGGIIKTVQKWLMQ
jgi:acetyl-CoA carboxylase carboxyltransferase component